MISEYVNRGIASIVLACVIFWLLLVSVIFVVDNKRDNKKSETRPVETMQNTRMGIIELKRISPLYRI